METQREREGYTFKEILSWNTKERKTVCVCVCVRERERERERQTDRQRKTEIGIEKE